MDGFYYLHTNGQLIWKKFEPEFEPEDDSSFVKRVWPINLKDRGIAWKIVLEALALGASIERIKELASKWNLDFSDSIEMLKRTEPTEEMKEGLPIFIEQVLEMNTEDFWKKVQESWKGDNVCHLSG